MHQRASRIFVDPILSLYGLCIIEIFDRETNLGKKHSVSTTRVLVWSDLTRSFSKPKYTTLDISWRRKQTFRVIGQLLLLILHHIFMISPEIRANIANIAFFFHYEQVQLMCCISFQDLITSHETYDDFCLLLMKIQPNVNSRIIRRKRRPKLVILKIIILRRPQNFAKSPP